MALSIFDDTRADWGARTPKLGGHPYVGASVKTILTWHWSGNRTYITEASAHTKCLSLIRAWQAYHMDTHGWRDIGYHILICVHGRIIEGCQGLDTAAAHAAGENTPSWGVQYMRGTGGGVVEHINLAQKVAGDKVARFLVARAGHSLRECGHRDMRLSSTSCPGDEIEAWIKAGRPMPAGSGGSGGSTPIGGGSTPIQQEEDPLMSLSPTNPATGATASPDTWASSVWSYAWQTYGLVKALAAREGVDVDEAAIAAALLADLRPAVSEAVTSALADAPQVDAAQVADKVVEALGNKLRPAGTVGGA